MERFVQECQKDDYESIYDKTVGKQRDKGGVVAEMAAETERNMALCL